MLDLLKREAGGTTILEILENVCDQWKMILLFIPRLRTTISIKFNNRNTILNFERAFASATTFLQRSGTLHISLIDQYSPPALDARHLLSPLSRNILSARDTPTFAPITSPCIQQSHPKPTPPPRAPRLFFIYLRVFPGSSLSYLICVPNRTQPNFDLQCTSALASFLWTTRLCRGTNFYRSLEVSLPGFLHVCTCLHSFSVPSVQSRFVDPLLGVVENRLLAWLTFTLNVSVLPNISPCSYRPFYEYGRGGRWYEFTFRGFPQGICSLPLCLNSRAPSSR